MQITKDNIQEKMMNLKKLIWAYLPTKNKWHAVWPDGYKTIQYLAIYNNDNLPRSIKMPKLLQKFAKY